VHGGAFMKESNNTQSPDAFSRKWLLVVILCMVPIFFAFVVLGDPGKGRAAAVSFGVVMVAIRTCWRMRKHLWFWVTAGILIALHVLLVLLIPWSDKSYPGLTLMPIGFADFLIMYGCFRLVEKLMKKSE